MTEKRLSIRITPALWRELLMAKAREEIPSVQWAGVRGLELVLEQAKGRAELTRYGLKKDK